MATQNIAAVPNKTYIQIHFRNVQSLCNIDNGNLSVKRTILANPTMDIPDHTYSLIRILDDRVITEPEEHEDKEIHSEEDIVYHDKCPFNKYAMENELLVDSEGNIRYSNGDRLPPYDMARLWIEDYSLKMIRIG